MSGVIGVYQQSLNTNSLAAEILDNVTSGRIYPSPKVHGVMCRHPAFLANYSFSPDKSPDLCLLEYKDLFLVADARIDNCEELAPILGINRITDERLDAIVIAEAFRKWGEECLNYLIGDFALIIYDSIRNLFFCGRDHIGVKPLYYLTSAEKGFCYLASDIEMLLALPNVEAKIDELEVAKYLAGYDKAYAYNKNTLYQGLLKLKFGSYIIFDGRKTCQFSYWKPGRRVNGFSTRTTPDLAEELHSLVNQAVINRIKPYPSLVGAHLSGGIDSSSVAILASRYLRAKGYRLSVFSWSPPYNEISSSAREDPELEHHRIETIAKAESLIMSYVLEADTEAGLKKLIMDDISILSESSMVYEIPIQQQASSMGINLILSGWGGDEGVSFSGRGTLPYWLLSGQWTKLFRECGFSRNKPRRSVRALRTFWLEAITPLLPDPLYFRFHEVPRLTQVETSFVSADLKKRLSSYFSSESPRVVARDMRGPLQAQLRLLENGHITTRMESWATYGARHGLTYAYPLTDRRVLEFVYSVPGDLFYYEGITRYLYRYAMKPVFPEGMVWQRLKQEPGLNWRTNEMVSNPTSIFPPFRYAKIILENHYLSEDYLKHSHPWIDTRNLLQVANALKRGYSVSQIPQLISVYRALKCLILYEKLTSG